MASTDSSPLASDGDSNAPTAPPSPPPPSSKNWLEQVSTEWSVMQPSRIDTMKQTLLVSVGLGAVLGLIRTSTNRQPTNPGIRGFARDAIRHVPRHVTTHGARGVLLQLSLWGVEAMRGARHDMDDAYVPLLVGGVYAVSQGPKAVVSAWSTAFDFFLLGLFIDVAKKNRELWSEQRGE